MEYFSRVGTIIGLLRRRYFKQGNVSFAQNEFIYDNSNIICSQSTLSRIENGHIVNYLEILHCFTNKFGYKFVEDESKYIEINNYANEYSNILEIGNTEDLKVFSNSLDKYSSHHDRDILIAQELLILEFSRNYYLHHNLPEVNDIELLIYLSNCFDEIFVNLLLDLVIWLQEATPYKSKIIQDFLGTEFTLDNQFFIVDQSLLMLRKGDFIESIESLTRVKNRDFNTLCNFRIERLRLLQNVNLSSYRSKVNRKDYKDFYDKSISKYEASKFYHLLGINEIYCENPKKALDFFNKAKNIYPPISVLSMQFVVAISNNIYKDYNAPYLLEIEKYISSSSEYYKMQYKFFKLLYLDKDENAAVEFLVKHLSKDLKKIKLLNIPYMYYESALLDIISKNKSYKSIFDFLSKTKII